ncbi:Cyclin A [Carabus blaptoides fortunei]
MATFRIHEDQENRRSEFRQKENIKNTLQQKRTVLGVIDNKPGKFAANLKQAPQAFNDLKNKDENAYTKQPNRKPIPAVPVAQFEAFKVYEDKPEEKKAEDSKSDEEHVIEKSEVDAVLPAFDKKILKKESPMSVDKSLVTCTVTTKPAVKVKQERDIFFEMPEYRQDIHKYLREAELRNRPKPGYMKKQPDITYSMRTILVDWLVEVAEEYRLQTETLYLAVSYIDRFLSYMSVVRAKLQLVGTAAMFIASKYEEIYPPDVGEFVYITDDTYNKKQVLRMEQLILKVLGFDLSIPTPLTFLTKFCVSSEQSEKIMFLAMYLCEMSMLEADPYLQYLPSMLAASAICVARDTMELEPWTSELEDTIGYTHRHLQPCVKLLQETFNAAATLQQQAIQEKYKSNKYQHVAMLLPRCKHEIEQKDN